MKLLKGSVVALVTPFVDDAAQSVNREKLVELVNLHANSKTAAIVPCGTTGESPTLLEEEWDAVVSTVIEAARNTNLKVIPVR
ncbi:MAG: dihydrodipicolinate synthase family protein [Methylovulum sp.]|nr:dihydrodipicolinate synthase family protein [Methylovulum sp.]